jgi:LacI family transcriptional regulator
MFLSQAERTTALSARVRGHEDALRAHGMKPEPDGAQPGQPIDADWVRRLIRRNPPDAIVCGSDYEAAGLLQAMLSSGVRVPQEIAIVGFNDEPCARLLPVALTTVRPPYADVGRTAVSTLLDRLENPAAPPREVRLTCELIVRESCGAALRGAASKSKR